MPNVEALWAIVSDLEGQGIEQMTEQAARNYKAAAMKRFSAATADLPRVLLAGQDLDRLMWHASPAEEYCLDWIGRYQLRTTDLIEANVGENKWQAFAAAAWPDVELFIDLMGDYTFGNGSRSLPHLQIAVRVNDGKCFDALTDLDKGLCLGLEDIGHDDGAEVTVRTSEDALDDQVNPASLSRAVSSAVGAARAAAEEDGAGVAQAIEIRLTLDSRFDASDGRLGNALRLMGLLFAFCDVQARFG